MCMCVLMLTNDNNITQNNKQTNRQKRMIKSKKKLRKFMKPSNLSIVFDL
mgnify:CR=1 FL=1